MGSSGLQRSERLDAIERQVLSEGSVQLADLAEEFGVSIMTIHRDLDSLQKRGAIRRARGLATALSSVVLESDMRYRVGHAVAAKKAVAAEAVKLVEPGQAVMLDDSSTAALMAEPVSAIEQTTVITNSAILLSTVVSTGTRFVSLGGEYQARYQAYGGLITERNICNLNPHIVFMSATAVQGAVAFHPDEDMVRVKRAMLDTGGMHVLLVDSRKFGGEALHRVADLSDFDYVITDDGMDPQSAANLREKRVNLVLASTKNGGEADTHPLDN
ncbi:MAG: DeoR/GlpR family DNA-binding transcription regulator [Scrofimicrobium sp.]